MSNKLFVGGISYSTSEDSLRDAFSKFGNVTEVRIVTDRESGRSKGFGFVTFETDEEANNAASELDGAEIDGRNIKVESATAESGGSRRQNNNPKSNKLFIASLSWDVDEDTLRSAFEKFGTIASVKIVTDRDTGKSRGFGFVEYENADAAESAMAEMNGQEIMGRNIRIDFASS
jgi:nucleolin